MSLSPSAHKNLESQLSFSGLYLALTYLTFLDILADVAELELSLGLFAFIV